MTFEEFAELTEAFEAKHEEFLFGISDLIRWIDSCITDQDEKDNLKSLMRQIEQVVTNQFHKEMSSKLSAIIKTEVKKKVVVNGGKSNDSK